MVSSITPEFRKKLKQYLKEHPIDPAYDEECELFDGDVPAEQLLARDAKEILEQNPEP